MESSPEAKSIAERLRSIGISESYAWQIANNKRDPSLKLALRIHRELGLKFGAIQAAESREISALQRVFPASGEAA